MIEWKQLPRSMRCEYDKRIADVWHMYEGWRWTVSNNGVYVAHGIEKSEDAACEAALRAMKV